MHVYNYDIETTDIWWSDSWNISFPIHQVARDENASLIYLPLNSFVYDPLSGTSLTPTTVQLHLKKLGRKQPYLPNWSLSMNCCSFHVSDVCAISMPTAFRVRWTFSTQVSPPHSSSVLSTSMILSSTTLMKVRRLCTVGLRRRIFRTRKWWYNFR